MWYNIQESFGKGDEYEKFCNEYLAEDVEEIVW